MTRKLLFVSLLAAMPALAGAQEAKLVNCRTLEAAGNFVGPDEVIVNDMVCQKVKSGTAANANTAAPAPKPLPGAVISGGEATSVVDAARAANQRVAAAKEAIREKAAQNDAESVTPPVMPPAAEAQSHEKAPDKSAAPEEPAKVPEPTAPATKAEVSAPEKSPAPETVVTPTEPAPKEPAAKPPESAPSANSPEPTQAPVQPVAAGPAPQEISDPQAKDAVGSFLDKLEEAIQPKPAEANADKLGRPTQNLPSQNEAGAAAQSTARPAESEAAHTDQGAKDSQAQVAPPQVDGVAPTPNAEPQKPEASREPQKPEATAPPVAATGSGFYDANAGVNVVTNPRPEDASKSTATGSTQTAPSAETTAKPDVAPAEAAPAPAAAEKAAQQEAQASLLAPDPNLPRDRVVQTDTFVEPREVGPDPAAEAHKTTFQPGDNPGFEEGHRPECTKNITLAGLKGEKLVLGTPGWAAKWIEKNQKRIPDVCFSDTPMASARNYLIVFYTSPMNADSAATANSTIAPDGTPVGGIGGFTLSYGSTWHYAQEHNVGVTVLTRDEADEPQSDIRNVWHATAYTETGVPIAEHWPDKLKRQAKPELKNASSKKAREARTELDRVSDELLGEMVGDIAKSQ